MNAASLDCWRNSYEALVALGGSEPDPLALIRRLESLPVVVERVDTRTGLVRVSGYPGGGRPSGVVRLEGADVVGVGECVAWTGEEQARFAGSCASALPAGRRTVGETVAAVRRATEDGYARVALEAAVLDLALRQAGTNLFELAGARPRPVTFVISFGVLAEPAGILRERLAADPSTWLKVDVDPDWPAKVLEELGRLGRVAILDLKLAGNWRTAERAHAGLPHALIEDPRLDPEPLGPTGEILALVERASAAGLTAADLVGRRAAKLASPSLAARAAFDQPVRRAEDVGALPLVPAAVNVKPARMGGILEALRAIAVCRGHGIPTYVGGMFEVGPGRSQVQVLASLFSPEAWNDVAPIALTAERPAPASPLAVPEVFVGLGFDEGAVADLEGTAGSR